MRKQRIKAIIAVILSLTMVLGMTGMTWAAEADPKDPVNISGNKLYPSGNGGVGG